MDLSLDDFLYEYVINNNQQINEENILRYKAINSYDLLIEYKNGDRIIYDTFANTERYLKYENDDLTDDEEIYEFKTSLQKIMKRKFVDQTELAKRIGVSQAMISKYVSGDSIPNAIVLKKIAKALNCSIEDFYYKHY